MVSGKIDEHSYFVQKRLLLLFKSFIGNNIIGISFYLRDIASTNIAN